ncbi:hypothetical protein Tco_1575067 [Tanacetum coccineum]
MDFSEFYKELEVEFRGAGAKLMGLQLIQLKLRLGKNSSRNFRPVKSAKILWQFWASCSLRVVATQTTNNNSIRSILEKETLNGSNFLDGASYTAIAAVPNAYTHRFAEQQEVACLMLVSMTPEIQKNLEDRPAFEILQELKTMFQQQAEQELFETVKAFHACKQEEGESVSTYVLKMKAYLDQMERLGYPMPLVLGVNMILNSLSNDYDQFMQNYNMHGMGKTILELHAMLKLKEKGTDIAKITRKPSKLDKHRHGKGKRIQEPGERYQRLTKVNPWSTLVNH